jgi:arylsulfatase A-like enzyme/Flp pilus assembly protein TadD
MQVFRRLFVVLVVSLLAGGETAPKAASAPSANTSADPSATPNPPNIILITLDTTRADRMGFLGSKRGLTPNLDALARESVVFTRAYAQIPLTTPSHAVLLTGTYPQFNHLDGLIQPLRPELPYLPDLLHQHGYHTAAFVGSMVLDPATAAAPGFDRGFDVYDADFHNPRPGEDRYHSLERRAGDVASRAMGWLSHNSQGPFFIWLHFYDAHEPYDPPEPFKAHYASEPYDGEIAYTDSVVGGVIDVLRRNGLFQNTVIAIAADHGEALGEHGEKWHGMFLYDETIRVPLLLKLPTEKFAGERVEAGVALADVAPSLLQAASVPIPASVQGVSLWPLMDAALMETAKSGDGKQSAGSEKKPAERAIYSETNYAHRVFGWSELRSWRAEKYLYVQAPKRELYDQISDPEALKNLATSAKAVADTLDGQLTDFRKKTGSAAVEQAAVDPAMEGKLRALGYLGSGGDGSNSSNKEQALIDPKDKIDFANKIHQYMFGLEEDHYAEAFAGLHELAEQYPADAGIAYLEFGKALIHLEKYQEAVPVLRSAVEKMPGSSSAHYQLGLALIKTGQWEAALPEIQAAVEHDPTSAQMHYYLAAVNNRLMHVPEASKEYEKTLELDPNHFQANLRYGRLLFLEGHPDAALPKLNRAAQVNPDSPEAHAFLADAYQKLGQADNAERERAKAAELRAQPE